MNGEFEGLSGLLAGWNPISGDVLPSFEYQPEPAAVPELEWVSPPPESADWSWEEWQRFASVSLLRSYEQSIDTALFGMPMPAMPWKQAAALYDRIQAAQQQTLDREREELARLYWSGPDKFARRVLREYGVSAAELGLVPRSAFSPKYRRRQRARVKRRRR